MLVPSAEILLLTAIIFMLPLVAMAESARLNGTVDLLAGPGSKSARVATLGAGTEVEVLGCRQSWCDVSAHGKRGWVYGACLTATDEGQAANERAPHRLPPLVLGPGPVRSKYFNPSEWPGVCPER